MKNRISAAASVLAVVIATATHAQQIRDGATDAITTSSPRLAGLATIAADVSNPGSVVIFSLDLNYSLDGAKVFSSSLSGLAIGPGGSVNLQHGKSANLATPGQYDLCVWISNVNYLGDDDNPGNDQVCRPILVLSQIPTHNVVLERFTGAWAGYGPDGRVVADGVANHPEAIPVAVHYSDAMEIPDGASLVIAYGPAFPQAMIDRFKFPGETEVELSRNFWQARVNERIATPVPASVTIDAQAWDSATRVLQVTVRAHFYGPVSGDIRLNALVLENEVVGMGAGYDQTNYYNNDPSHPYYSYGNPIVGFDHIDVLRAMLGGPWGMAGIVPSVVGDGESYAYTFSHTLPAGQDPTEITLVGLVQLYRNDPDHREILNATSAGLATTGCTALHGANETLQDDTLLEILTIEVCDTISAGPNYEVVGPDGVLTLRAGQEVILRDGFSVGVDGFLVIDIDPSLIP